MSGVELVLAGALAVVLFLLAVFDAAYADLARKARRLAAENARLRRGDRGWRVVSDDRR